jgi:hypothetical protein
MRLPRVRFTVRTLMLAVAVVAGVFAAEQGVRRSEEYRVRARRHEARLRTLALVRQHGYYPYCSLGIEDLSLVYNAATAPLHARCVAYHTRLMQKYRRARWMPWLSVEPEPPTPFDEP